MPVSPSRLATPTKTLAKVANRFAKQDPATGGVCLLLDETAQRGALGRIELTDLWGIGARLARRLEGLGIDTPLKLRDAGPHFMHFSVVTGGTLWGMSNCATTSCSTPAHRTRSLGRFT